jgi:hypothetical protein
MVSTPVQARIEARDGGRGSRALPFPLPSPARSLPQRCPISCAFFLVLRYEQLDIWSLSSPSATPASPSSGVRGAIALFYPHRCVFCILRRRTTPHPLVRGQKLASSPSHDGVTRPNLSPCAPIARPPPLMSSPQGMLAHEHINHISCIRHTPTRLAARVRFSSARSLPGLHPRRRAAYPAGAFRPPAHRPHGTRPRPHKRADTRERTRTTMTREPVACETLSMSRRMCARRRTISGGTWRPRRPSRPRRDASIRASWPFCAKDIISRILSASVNRCYVSRFAPAVYPALLLGRNLIRARTRLPLIPCPVLSSWSLSAHRHARLPVQYTLAGA